MAVLLLLAIAGVLAWGSFYEARFGTEAVQRFVYHSVWFQLLLVFLAVNLAAAAWQRYPWQRKHIPFVLAHIGIILTLIGGILGGRFGIEGQLIIPEGEAAHTLRLPSKVLAVHMPNPGAHQVIPTNFESTAWIHEPNALFPLEMEGRTITLRVDRYYPNAEMKEEIIGAGTLENPAIHLRIGQFLGEKESGVWLFSRDPHRFGVRFGKAHIFFLESKGEKVPLPSYSIAIFRSPQGKLTALLTGERGQQKRIHSLRVGERTLHPWLGLPFWVSAYHPRAQYKQQFLNKDNQIRQEALRIIAQEGESEYAAWLTPQEPKPFFVGKHPIIVEYRPGSRGLPFSVKLLDFRKIDYPGTEMAAGFESDVELFDPHRGITLKRTIRMNNPLKMRGYSLFQSSYIPPGPPGALAGASGSPEATVLSVRNDPGIPLVYGGFLFIIAGVVTMFIFRRPELLLLPLLLGLGPAAFASPEEPQPLQISADRLEELAHRPVQHLGRIKPFDSFARESLRRITGEERLKGQDPVATILSIASEPQRWQESPILLVPFIPLRQALGLDEKRSHISYSELIAGRKLMPMLPPIVEKQSRDEKLSMLENEVMDLYDRFVTMNSLLKGEVPFIQERPARDLRWRLRLEVFYNRAAPFRIARVFYVAAAVLLLLFCMNPVGARRAAFFGMLALWAAFLIHGSGIAARVFLGERPPVSNFYETMLWLPFVGVGLALLFERIYRGTGIFGFAGATFSAIVLLLADHVPLDSSISPVVAVLRSNLWLTIHVLTIVGSYAPLAVAMVLSHLYGGLYLGRGEAHPLLPSLDLFLYRLIQVGVVLLAGGIMLGAIWANASWGRYWGWDPKETWALITLLWFLAVLHGRFAGWLKGVWVALSVIGGFFLVVMTYYGVSFYLVGLHSYAGGHAKPLPPLLMAYLLAEAAFMSWVGFKAAARRQMAS